MCNLILNNIFISEYIDINIYNKYKFNKIDLFFKYNINNQYNVKYI